MNFRQFVKLFSILDLFGPVWTCLDQFGPVWACFDMFRPILTYFDLFWPIWTHLEQFRPIQTHLNLFEFIWTQGGRWKCHCKYIEENWFGHFDSMTSTDRCILAVVALSDCQEVMAARIHLLVHRMQRK